MADYQFKVRSVVPGAFAVKQVAITQVAGYPAVATVTDSTSFGTSGADFSGTYHETLAAEVAAGTNYGPLSALVGVFASPTPEFVIEAFGPTGHFHVPTHDQILDTVMYGDHSWLTGSYHEATEAEVELGVTFGSLHSLTGTLVAGGSTDVRPRNP